jgi:hypothetical protein
LQDERQKLANQTQDRTPNKSAAHYHHVTT